MQKEKIGHIIIVMAPTGSGKGTLIRCAQAEFPELHVTISCTTRAMRPGEVGGKEYHFITNADFDKKIADGEFLEWATFGLNRYGTPKSEILPYLEAGKVVVAEIELQGVESLCALLPKEQMTTVYIDAGGWETLKTRAVARAPMSEEELEKRYERYLVEVGFKEVADVIIDNRSNDFSSAKFQFNKLIEEIYSKIKQS